MKVVVVIPTFNEEKTIKQVVEGAGRYFPDILVVSAKKSADRTAEIARQLGAEVIVDNGMGKGAAIRQAIDYVSSDIIVFMDADGSHEVSDIPKLIAPILDSKADLVVASRMKGGSDELHGTFGQLVRNVGTSLIMIGINFRFNTHLTDCENGFRAVRTDVARRLKLNADDFDIEQEMFMKALRKGYRVVEVPSHEYDRKHGSSNIKLLKIGWKFIWRFFVELF